MSTAVQYDPRLVESVGAQLQIQRDDRKVIRGFLTPWGWVPLTPELFKGQLYYEGIESVDLQNREAIMVDLT